MIFHHSASSVAWRSQLLSASSLCHLVMKHSAASTTPRHQFPPFLAAVGHSTVSTLNTKGTLSARNTLRSSARHWAQFFSGRIGPGFSPPAIVPNITRRVSRSLCVRCTPPGKEETPFPNGRLDALALCLLKVLGLRHEVVCALSALEANDP